MSDLHPGAVALARLMAERGLKAAHVVRDAAAKDLSISHAMLSYILAGKKPPGLDSAKALAALFGEPITTFMPELAELMGELGSPSVTPPGIGRAPLASFALSPTNERKQVADDATVEMAGTIAEQGLLQPLLVSRNEGSGLLLVEDGGRRWRALKLLDADGLLPPDLAEHGIPYWVMSGDEAARRTASILANLQREDTNPMDRAEAYAHLRDLGMSPGDMVRAMGRSGNHYRQYLQIAERLSDADKAKLRANLLTFREARDLVQDHEDKRLLSGQMELARAAAASSAALPPGTILASIVMPPLKPTTEDYRAAVTLPQADAQPVRERVKRVLAEYLGTDDAAVIRSFDRLREDLRIPNDAVLLFSGLRQEFGVTLADGWMDRVATVGDLTRYIIGLLSPTITGTAGAAPSPPYSPRSEPLLRHSAVGGGITDSPWVIHQIGRRLNGTPTDITLRHTETDAKMRFVPEQRDLEDAAE